MNDITKFTTQGVTSIRSVNILEPNDMKSITELSTELQRVYEVKQIWRTETEMRISVLNKEKFPDPPARYWQSVREQDVFFTNLISLSCQYQKTQGELDLLEIELEEIQGTSKKAGPLRKIKDAEIKEKKFALMNMRLMAKDRVREIKLWEKLKKEQLEEQTFNINDPNSEQLESYRKRFEREMANSKFHSKALLDTLKEVDHAS